MERRHFMAKLAGLGILSGVDPYNMISQTAASDNYTIEQFEEKGLAHYSYAVVAGKKMIVIDPQRDPRAYYNFAIKNNAVIVGIIETHPHADFVSAHLEMQKKLDVPIYASSLTKPQYRATSFDDGKFIPLTPQVALRSMYTPGHAPDHISAVLVDTGKDIAVFCGDSLLIGDVGRPDLRDFSKDVQAQRERLAEMMYDTLHQKFAKLDENVIVYPAHGAGSLCGKSIRKAASSTIGYEKQHNYAFEKRTKQQFVSLLLADQPFIPKYFPFDVKLNMQGAPELATSLSRIKHFTKNHQPKPHDLIIDTRLAANFKASHLPNAINIQGAGAFETWLGTLVAPDTEFYVTGTDQTNLEMAIKKCAAIGYEARIKGAFIYDATDGVKSEPFDANKFNASDDSYTILDVRTEKEVKQNPAFGNSIHIPLQDLSDRLSEVPTNKPILVHCASGYRSAAASSILQKSLPKATIYDLGAAIGQYLNSGSQK
ncbi:MBL fold metallo-hydrolase [Dyadobacter luteus]|uniref:MBL fold metallo-hydrolase n=1 Tax=Dyadobacter luteus TaxID=2259619 RepID=A0A3D8Y9L5_9BACT|nr:MBL fold metallo-hydrolase [Dyadobacter luteus]REA60098.1 MBL fold metallo-hydrolase [Dyadobacter luteus]